MDRYFFIHVPKSAGTSMFRIFRDLLGPENVGPMLADFGQVDIEAVSRFRLLGGHMEFHEIGRFGQRRLFTVLRHPVDHVISRYCFYRSPLTAFATDPLAQMSKDLSLEELVAQEPQGTLRFFFNTAVWQLAGLGFSKHQSGSEVEALRLAKDHLAQCDFVGILEQFTDSLDLMSYTFGWPPVEGIPKENVTPDRVPLRRIDPELQRRIRERSCLDMELYEYGLSLFTKQKRGMMRAAVCQKRPADPAPPPAAPTQSAEPAGRALAAEVAGTGRVRIIHTEVFNSLGRGDQVCSGEVCTVGVLLLARENVASVTVQLIIANQYGQVVFGCRSASHGVRLTFGAGEIREILFRMPFRLATGPYTVTVSAFKGDWDGVPDNVRFALAGQAQEIYDLVVNAATIYVTRLAGSLFIGPFDLAPSVWARGDRDVAQRLDCDYAHPILFSRSGLGAQHLCAGWSDPEEWGAWTTHHDAHLIFGRRRFPNRDVVLRATVHGYCPAASPSLTVNVILNDQQLTVWHLEGDETRVLEVRIPATLSQGPFLHLVFRVLDPRSPAMLGQSGDDRMLGIGLHQIEFCDPAECSDDLAREGS